MKTTTLHIIGLITLIGCQPSQVDYRPFEKLNMDEDPAVYFFLSEGDWDDFEETIGNFALKDKAALQKISDNWGFTKTDDRMSCGFGYVVFITNKGKLVEQIAINEPCGYAVTTGGWYDFDDHFYDFVDLSKIKGLTKNQADSIRSLLVNQEKNSHQ